MLRKIVLTSVLASSTLAVMTANAALPSGLYVSGQVGYADTNRPSTLNPNLANDGLAGRLAIGYKLIPSFAVELGYLQLPTTEVSKYIPGHFGTLSNKQHAIDVVAKGILPITSNVNIYGKLGAAYLTTQIQGTTTVDNIPVTVDLNSQQGIEKRQWAPEVAIGMGYDITPNVSVDTSLTHIQTIGNNRPGNIDFLAVGVAYTFG
ncbi:MAG: porin family protein [Candidatus Aquirickettsiella gammari]|jgi:hypothetical protein|uniref:Porin family protein n=1 Tax=Candidatus Aquirickettsiella gammari TaxID=2016198 RepID=A0A370CIZ8_9COXI|nr:MAG: porin family protein [Candidatus Aquirickettsiella gammari]